MEMNTSFPPENGKKKFFIIGLLAVVLVLGYFAWDLGIVRVFPPTEKEIKAVRTYPPEEATEKERAAYDKLVNRVAEENIPLSIGPNCAITPLALRVKEGDAFFIKNNDTVFHSITLVGQMLPVAPGETREVIADFPNGPTKYGYGCDGTPDMGGVITVEAKAKAR
jgi:hypothetical protein